MKANQKSYVNFKVTDDALSLKTEQEPVKTNVAAIESIRKEQCKSYRQETFPVHVKYSAIATNMSFNDWSAHINKLLTDKKQSYVSTFGGSQTNS